MDSKTTTATTNEPPAETPSAGNNANPSSPPGNNTDICNPPVNNTNCTNPGNSTIGTPSKSTSNGQTISAGGAVGVGIGCLFAGAVLAVFGFIIFQKIQRSKVRRVPSTLTQNVMSRSRSLYDELPQSVDHHELRNDIANLDNSIKNFVDNFFSQKLSAEPVVNENGLRLLASVWPIMPQSEWIGLLMSARTRPAALRAIITRAIMSAIDPRGDARTSLLPLGIVESFASITSKEKQPQRATDLSDAWRSLTALLLSSSSHVSIQPDDLRARRIRETATELNQTLASFRNRKLDDGAQRILESILEEAALFGLKIFSQIERVSLDWGKLTGQSLVVFPGFKQSMKGGIKGSGGEVQITDPKYA